MIINLQELKEASSIVKVISEYLQLKKVGANYQGLCPFHEEKTPSFNVSPAKGIYKCFGCGQSGDALKFIMDYEGLSLPEAAQKLAQGTSVQLEYKNGIDSTEFMAEQKKLTDRRKELIQVNERLLAGILTPENKKSGSQGFKIGRKKPYPEEIAARFELFQYPKAPYLTKKTKESYQSYAELGLIKEGKQAGTFYEPFEDRYIFPIREHTGKLVGFGGRRRSDSEAAKKKKPAKYVNSSDSIVYEKSRVLYGLYQAKKSIREQNEAILVEGYTDVLRLHEFGYTNAIASCGTAFTEEQGKLLSHYSDNLLCIYDGDDAGRKAFFRNLPTFIKCGFNVRVLFLPNESDPDSFLSENGTNGLDGELEVHLQDGIKTFVLDGFDAKSVAKREAAISKAADILASISDLTRRQVYLQELTKSKELKNYKRLIEDAVDDRVKIAKSKLGNDLTPVQRGDIINYGLYEKGNRYYVSNNVDSMSGFSISNFTIKPIMLIIGSQHSHRIFEVKNVYNRSFTLNLETKDLTTLGRFQEQVERMGNFIFHGKTTDYIKVKRKIYESCPAAFPITTMGKHKEGFYTWGNGISVDGKFKPVDEFGVVEHQGIKYFLPAFSKLREQFKSDDSDNDYEYERKFSFYPTREPMSFTRWTELMSKVFGYNGRMAVAYYCAALFRDLIFSLQNCFPLLFLFGEPSSGKSYLAWSLMAMFGKGTTFIPYNLSTGTLVGLNRQLSQVRNGIVWADEYRNDIDFSKVEVLKGSYDGAGRVKGIASQDNRTVTNKINSALMVSGQQQPTQDNALFTRVISLSFRKNNERTAEDINTADFLKQIEDTGNLTNITQSIVKHYQTVEENFFPYYEKLRSIITATLRDENVDTTDRMIKNYMTPLAILQILTDKCGLNVAFDITQFLEDTIKNMKSQADSMTAEDEVSVFWQMFSYGVSKGILKHDEDFKVESRTDDTFYNPGTKGSKDDLQIDFGEPKELIYVSFTKTHPEYMEKHRTLKGTAGLQLNALQHYLKNSAGYIGEKKKKWIAHSCKVVYVFDLSKVPAELPDYERIKKAQFGAIEDE